MKLGPKGQSAKRKTMASAGQSVLEGREILGELDRDRRGRKAWEREKARKRTMEVMTDIAM